MIRQWTVVAFFLASPLLAYNPEYAPWVAGNGPKTIALSALKIETTLDGSVVFYRAPRTPSRMLTLARYDDEKGIRVTAAVTSADGEIIVGPDDVDAAFMFPDEAYVGDINGDRIDDFVAFIPSGGNGIGGVLSQVVVALSGDGTYSITLFPSFFGGDNDLVRLEDGGAAVLQTLLIFGEPGADSKTHNYWVYMLYPIDRSRVRMNQQPPGWPKWVQCTNGANHRETSQLSAEQKRRLLSEAGYGE